MVKKLLIVCMIIIFSLSSCDKEVVNTSKEAEIPKTTLKANVEDKKSEVDKVTVKTPDKSVEVVTITYKGTIDNKYQIEMRVNVEGFKIEGAYFYTDQKKDIKFTGVIKNDTMLLNTENGEEVFNGVVNNGKYSGTWTYKNKDYSFELKDINIIDYSEMFTVVKKDYSAHNYGDTVLDEIYYDLPIISGVSGAEYINRTYAAQMSNWLIEKNRLNFYSDGIYNDFEENFYEYRNPSPKLFTQPDLDTLDKELSKSPMQLNVNAYLTYFDKNYVSILQEGRYQKFGGTNDFVYFGNVYNAENGELVSVDEFVGNEVYSDEFIAMFAKKLLDKLGSNYGVTKNDVTDMFKYMNSNDKSDDFMYSYVYDGESIYFIPKGLNIGTIDSVVLKWNMKTGDEMEIEIVYNIDGFNTIETKESVEKTIVSMNIENSDKYVILSVNEVEDYVIFRMYDNGELVLEYPNNLEDSWKAFGYYEYHRGGGAENEGYDLNSILFEDDINEYMLFEQYSYSHGYSCGLTVTNKSTKNTGEGICYSGDMDSRIGNINDIAAYEKMPKVE